MTNRAQQASFGCLDCEFFPRDFFLSFKTNHRVQHAKKGYGPHFLSGVVTSRNCLDFRGQSKLRHDHSGFEYP